MNRQQNILISALSLFLIFMGILPAAAQNVVLQESFDSFDGAGGNDGRWSYLEKNEIKDGELPKGWNFSPNNGDKYTVYKGNKCVYIGVNVEGESTTASGNAYIETPAIEKIGTYMVYFKAGAMNTTSEKTVMQITESTSGTVDIEQSQFNLKKGAFSEYSTKIVVKKANASIRFGNVYRKDNRFLLDEIKIVSIETQDQEPIKANYVYKRATTFEVGKEYLIVSEDSKGNWYIADPTSSKNSNFTRIPATQTKLGILANDSNPYNTYLIRFLTSGKAYTLQSLKTSLYISSNSSNTFTYSTSRGTDWAIDDNPFGEDGRFIVKCNDRYLRMSEGNTNDDFRTYKYETDDQCPIFLYEKVSVVPSGTITINAKEGYGTFYSDKSIIMPEGLCGATVTDVTEGGKLKYNWKYNAGDVVPANTGLLLYTSQPGSYDYYEATESTSAMPKVSGLDQTNDVVGSEEAQEVNYLHGTTTDETITEDDATYKFYQLTYGTINGTRTIGFFFENANGGVFLNKANKAYLCIPRNVSANSAFSLDKNNPIMGIAENMNQIKNRKQVYDISGKRITATDKLQKGIYIVNGKKLIIR